MRFRASTGAVDKSPRTNFCWSTENPFEEVDEKAAREFAMEFCIAEAMEEGKPWSEEFLLVCSFQRDVL